MRVRAAVLQLAPAFGETDKNLDAMARAVQSLNPATNLVVAPELFATGYDLAGLSERHAQLAEPLAGPTAALVTELAIQRGITIVFGMLERGDDGALYDTAVVVGPDAPPTAYRKTHLYPAEHGVFAPGDSLVTVSTAVGRLGLMICFEHAFPEVATTLALRGAQILVVPSAVPSGFEHLLSLRTRARAQDNQVFVVAANLTGDGFCGGSLIVDPRGEVLAAAGPHEGSIDAELDLDAIERERALEPALRLRRPLLYG